MSQRRFDIIRTLLLRHVSAEMASVKYFLGLRLGLRPANERRRYKVTASLIGWPQA